MNLFNLWDDASMRFAFWVSSYNKDETRLDPRYVKTLTYVFTKDNDGNKSEQMISHHACTDEDWAQFAPPSEAASL